MLVAAVECTGDDRAVQLSIRRRQERTGWARV